MKRSKTKSHGIIFGLLYAVCFKLSSVFHSGMLYKMLTSYNNNEDSISSSALCNLVGALSRKSRKAVDAVKKYTARQFERSFMLRFISAALSSLVSIPGRVIGAFGLTWGAYVVLINLIKRFALVSPDISNADFAVGCIAFLSSLPLLFTDKTLCRMALESKLVFTFLNKVFGVPAETIKSYRAKKSSQSIAVILGIIFGLATYFISPLDMFVGAFAFAGFVLILRYPEGGVLISIAIAPLLGLVNHSSIVLASFVLLTAFSFVLKVLRGKRVLKVGFAGLSVYSFMFVIFLSGFAPGASNTMENALLCCSLMLIFPLIVNLMTTKQWLNACVIAFAFPSAIVAVIGFIQYMLGVSPSGWIDNSLYSEITQRTVSVFNNPNILGAYLSAMFPIALMLASTASDKKVRALGGISAAYIAVATVFTYSRSAWIALIAGAILFAVMITPKGILWLIPIAAVTVVLSIVFPNTIGMRLLNFISLSDSANNYRIAVWNSSWNLLTDSFLHGIGWGEEAFRTAYINYATDGTQYAMHSHSLYMQIAIQTGIIGLIVFFMVIVTVFRKCFSASSLLASDKKLSATSKAALSASLSIMISGIFDYTWYNFRIFFVFWALLALACAAANANKVDGNVIDTQYDENYSYITVRIPANGSKYTDN